MADEIKREVVTIGTDLKARQDRMVWRFDELAERARRGEIEGAMVVAVMPGERGYHAHWVGNTRLSQMVGSVHRALHDLMLTEPGEVV